MAAVEVGWLGVKGEPLLGSTMDMVKALRIKGVVEVKMRALAATFKWAAPGSARQSAWGCGSLDFVWP